jgi:hypothetical protein
MRRTARVGFSAFIVVAGAVHTWLRSGHKPFTTLVPGAGQNLVQPDECQSCGNRRADLEVEPIGEVDYRLCRSCRKKVAA